MDSAKGQLRLLIAMRLLDILLFGTWFWMWHNVPAESRSWFYQSKYQITVVEQDPDFGETTKQELIDKVTPGLTDNVLPVWGALNVGALGWILVKMLKADKAAKAAKAA
jgi:hypothetical protein